MKFVRIAPGSFKMGSGRYGPIHDVTLGKGFYLQTTAVTQAQWQAVMGTDRSWFKGPDWPVEQVSWDDTQEFLRKLNAREKDTRYRLPTEAEWEYACRAGGSRTWLAIWTMWPGGIGTPDPRRTRWARRNRMPGGCTNEWAAAHDGEAGNVSQLPALSRIVTNPLILTKRE